MLGSGSLETITARLILAIGSRTGLEAPLQLGYYMIGRHAECQIRPKSRSVSRRHCLIHHHQGGLRILDLSSASGTYVNGKKLDPMTWSTLGDGAMLRCGKVLFQVSIQTAPVKAAGRSAEKLGVPAVAASPESSMVSGKAWHDVDIAGFLEEADDADRQERYQSIRAHHGSAAVELGVEHEDRESDTDIDLDLFEDVFDDDLVYTASPTKPGDEELEGAAKDEASDADRGRAESSRHQPDDAAVEPKVDASAKPAKTRPAKNKSSARLAPPPKKTRKQKAPRAGWNLSAGPEQLKLIGAAVVMIAVLGVLGYKAYQFYSGPEVRVLQNID